MSRRVLLISDEGMLKHDGGPGNPERPQRLAALLENLRNDPVRGVEWATPDPAPRRAIESVHTPRHVEWIDHLRGQRAWVEPETQTNPGSVEAAYLAAGGAIAAVDAVVNGEPGCAVALVRPPGHHAEPDRSMGFCFFNNIAIAAIHAIEHHNCRRVLVIDWDVHHGNGTEAVCRSRADILFVSSHQSGIYPGSGALHDVGTGAGTGYTMNLPLPAGFGDGGMVALYESILLPVAAKYQPDLVLVSAGFDAHERDPLASLALTERGFAALTGLVLSVAQQHCEGRISLLLEGGYDVTALVRSARACIEVLAGTEPPSIDPPEDDERAVIDAILAAHRARWPV